MIYTKSCIPPCLNLNRLWYSLKHYCLDIVKITTLFAEVVISMIQQRCLNLYNDQFLETFIYILEKY